MTRSLNTILTAGGPHPAETWRAEAEVLRRGGWEEQARVAESYACRLEAWWREYQLQALTLEEAAQESGYSYSALEKNVRRGNIPNAGEPGRPRIRRGNLPRKGGPISLTVESGELDLASIILRNKACARGT